MKKTYSIIFLSLVTAIAFAGKGLVVTQKYNTGKDGQSVTVTWYVTETQCKLKMLYSDKDINTVNYFIPDVSSSKLLSYTEGATPAGVPKTYYSIPVSGIKSALEASVVERTGETKMINGMNCEKIISKTATTTTEMWVTKDFKADYYRFASFFKNSNELKALNESSIKGFPLVSVTKDKSGKVLNAYELVSVSATEIADSEFTVPSDYKSAEEVSKKK
jgi:hypothetical protein